MTAIDCRNCLSNSIVVKATSFSGKKVARMIQIHCNFKFDERKFFLGYPMISQKLHTRRPAKD